MSTPKPPCNWKKNKETVLLVCQYICANSEFVEKRPGELPVPHTQRRISVPREDLNRKKHTKGVMVELNNIDMDTDGELIDSWEKLDKLLAEVRALYTSAKAAKTAKLNVKIEANLKKGKK